MARADKPVPLQDIDVLIDILERGSGYESIYYLANVKAPENFLKTIPTTHMYICA
jgi:hypothetical protein